MRKTYPKGTPCPPFGEQCRAARKNANASQAQLAKYLGMSVRTLQNWEMGRNEPCMTMQSLLLPRLMVFQRFFKEKGRWQKAGRPSAKKNRATR